MKIYLQLHDTIPVWQHWRKNYKDNNPLLGKWLLSFYGNSMEPWPELRDCEDNEEAFLMVCSYLRGLLSNELVPQYGVTITETSGTVYVDSDGRDDEHEDNGILHTFSDDEVAGLDEDYDNRDDDEDL